MSILSNTVRVGTAGITVAAISLAGLPVARAATPSAGAASRQPASRQENIGVFTGLAVGAAATGPIGAVGAVQASSLRKIGALAAALPSGARVRIDGYADPRGPAALNDDLALRRAQAVARALQQAGCPQERLVIAGHGSSQSTSQRGDLDAYAFDRHVMVRLEGAAVAQTTREEQPAVAAR